MSDPQTWTLIGVFAAAILGGLTLVVTMLSRVIRAEIGGVRADLGGQIGGLRGELSGDIGGLHARFDSLEKRVDNLDRDVQAITDRLWRRDRDA